MERNARVHSQVPEEGIHQSIPSEATPSAITAADGGFGGQIGFELTDFVCISNDFSAVKTFSQQGSIALGGNVSIAARLPNLLKDNSAQVLLTALTSELD
ncbi:hypothetical protein F4678DRAFT_458779 [Xylaria arbuscula]|nr:hypothetical protein F4678DRAFT_458779 [Xylaria arbuscula]